MFSLGYIPRERQRGAGRRRGGSADPPEDWPAASPRYAAAATPREPVLAGAYNVIKNNNNNKCFMAGLTKNVRSVVDVCVCRIAMPVSSGLTSHYDWTCVDRRNAGDCDVAAVQADWRGRTLMTGACDNVSPTTTFSELAATFSGVDESFYAQQQQQQQQPWTNTTSRCRSEFISSSSAIIHSQLHLRSACHKLLISNYFCACYFLGRIAVTITY